MKPIIPLFIIFLFAYFITKTKEDLCPEDQISISALGKCKKIEDILEGRDLLLKSENLFYLATNDEGKIDKNGYKLEIFKLNDTKLQSHNMKKSKLYIPNSCMEEMEKHENIKLKRNAGIVILVYDSNNPNKNNISDKYFIIRHNSINSSFNYIYSKQFDFTFCNKDPILFEDEEYINNLKYNYTDNRTIDIKTILYGKKYGIDLFDLYSDFFNDICFKFKSEKGTDVTLESRVEDLYQNITFCDDKENAHYLAYNYSDINSTINSTITYRCAFGYYKNEKNKLSYLDKIDTELKSYVSVSNIKVITCYKQFLNLRDIITNYGGMICIVVLIIQIICFLIFCFLGNKNIKKQLNHLFNQGKEIIIRRQSKLITKNVDSNIEKEKEKEKEIEKEININNNVQENNTQNSKSQIIVQSNPPKKTNQEIVDDQIQIEKTEEKINNKEQRVETGIDEKNLNNKILGNKLSSSMIKKTEDERDKETNIDKQSEASQLYEYESDELNELPYDKAIKYDKRSFCVYYFNILIVSHIILNVFFRQNDYNIFVVKLGLLLMTFPINLTFNILFFTNKSIKLNYMNSMKDISNFWNNAANSVYSSILSSALLIMLKFISYTHNSVRELRKLKDVHLAEEKSHCILRCIKIRLFLYFFLSFIFLIIFGFYVLSFCAIFENTQITVITSTFSSWLISLIYPFIICLLTSIFRTLSFKCNSKCLYKIKQILQFL